MGIIDLDISPMVNKIIDKVADYFPSEEAKNKAKIALMQAQDAGDLDVIKVQMSAILAEAQSSDPWTSRARPSFLYVIYLMLLMGIPMGFLSAYDSDLTMTIAGGFNAWLTAIPEALYTLFGVGYLGYTGARTWEKNRSKA